MRIILIIALIAALALVLAGCAKKRTVATKVENPPEKKPVEVQSAPMPEKPAPVPKTPAPDAKGWVTTASGLEYKDTKVGTKTVAKSGDYVTVHYKGWLDNGKVFDTSRKIGGKPFSFSLGSGQVIPGWDEGVAGMKVGGIRELKIPSALGYGSQDMGDIPPDSTLHFNVELLSVGG